MLKLNLGPGDKWHEDGWTCLEVQKGYDLNKKLLSDFQTNSVDLIFFSHCLEHIPWKTVPSLLRDCHRVMKPGTVMRIIVPDVDILWDILENDRKDLLELDRWKKNPMGFVKTNMGYANDKAFLHVEYGHNSFYSFSSLGILLRFAGFTNIKKSAFGQSSVPEMRKTFVGGAKESPTNSFDNDVAAKFSLFVECTK